MRLFVAIPLDEQHTSDLFRLVTRLRRPGDGLRWSRSEGWHITLQFLGNVTPEQLTCLLADLSQVHHTPFDVQFDPPGTFERSGVFFLGVRLSPRLLALQQSIVATTKPCGFAAEDRPYHPHITLARLQPRARNGLDALRRLASVTAPTPTPQPVREFVLYQSTSAEGGSLYTPLHRFLLG